MTESINFEGILKFGEESVELHRITTPSGKVWDVKDQWLTENDKMVQVISITNKDVESYYYVDLEVSSIEKSANKILKSVRMLSSNILFKITEDEYACFGLNCTKVADSKVAVPLAYRCKVILAPIFQFMNVQIPPEKLKKMKKRTKIDFLDGVKDLSNNMAKMLANADGLNYSDVVLRCGYKEILAHRNILSARSKLFRRIFCELGENIEEPRKDLEGLSAFIVSVKNADYAKVEQKPERKSFFVAELTNVNPEDFENFIRFLYTGKCEIQDYRKAKCLFKVSRTYGVYDLERKCLLVLKSEESVWAQFKIYHFALRYQQEMLKRHVMDRVAFDIIRRNMNEWREKKWMTIFERYQKPFFEYVTIETQQRWRIGTFNPEEHREVQRSPNNVGNEITNNVGSNENNDTNGVQNNDILRNIHNVTFRGDVNAGYYLYGTAYFDTKDAPKEFDDSSSTTISNFEATNDTEDVYDDGAINEANGSGANEGDSDANGSNSDANRSDSDANESHSGANRRDSDANESHSGANRSDSDANRRAANESHSGAHGSNSDANASDSYANGGNSGANESHSGANGGDADSNESHSGKDKGVSRDAHEVDISDTKEVATDTPAVDSDTRGTDREPSNNVIDNADDDDDDDYKEDYHSDEEDDEDEDPHIKYILKDIRRIINT